MNKIAIVTTHRANNYGAMLQCYSLVHAFRENAIEAVVLDWRCKHFEWLFHYMWRMHRNPIPALRRLIDFCGNERYSRRLFDKFRKSLPLTRVIKDRRMLPSLEKDFDGFVVGSDQVWNPFNSANNPLKFDRTNLLDFVKCKPKYAYAASIGLKDIEPPSLQKEFVEAWKTFSIITTREHAAAVYVQSKSNVAAESVLDPVLLHDRVWWTKVAEEPNMGCPYLVFYNVRSSKTLIEYANEMSKKTGLKIVNLLTPGQHMDDFGEIFAGGPREFVGLIKNADAVVTNSFHASAFSLIFRKELHVEQKVAEPGANSRVTSLMQYGDLAPKKEIMLTDRKISVIDCSNANFAKLEQERLRSFEYIKKMRGYTR